MKQAKVVKPFKGAPDGEVYPVEFKEGDVVRGDLARVAIENKWAKEISEKPERKSREKPAADAPKTAADLLKAQKGMKADDFMAAAEAILGDEMPEDDSDVEAALQLRAEEDTKKKA